MTVKKNKGARAENIAEVALLRTGLVSLKQSSELDFDIIACDKNNPDKVIAIDVKEVKDTKEQILKIYRNLRAKFFESYLKSRIPIILFFIDAEKEAGFFTIFGEEQQDKIFPLRMDVFTKQLKGILKIYSPVEFPPYKFYQNSSGSKYETWTISVDEKFKILRLFNISLSPMNAKTGLSLEIIVDGGNSKKQFHYDLMDLFYNPKLPDHLFFIEGANKHIDIALPNGRKWVTIRVSLLSDIEEFDISLACRYI